MIPGLEKYPDLKEKYELALAAAKATQKCRDCDDRAVIRRYRILLEQRLERDKPRKWV